MRRLIFDGIALVFGFLFSSVALGYVVFLAAGLILVTFTQVLALVWPSSAEKFTGDDLGIDYRLGLLIISGTGLGLYHESGAIVKMGVVALVFFVICRTMPSPPDSSSG